MDFGQTNRILRIVTDLGVTRAVLWKSTARTRSPGPPRSISIRFSTEADDPTVDALLGTNMKIWFGRLGEAEDDATAIEARVLHGRIHRLTRGFHAPSGETDWRAEVVPALWFLSRAAANRKASSPAWTVPTTAAA